MGIDCENFTSFKLIITNYAPFTSTPPVIIIAVYQPARAVYDKGDNSNST